MVTRSTTVRRAEGPLRLEAIAGPEVPALVVKPGGSATLGRSMQNDMVLLDGTVSREHAVVQDRAGNWLLTDRGSRHGTTLNGVAITPEEPAPIVTGDLVRVGPWTMRVSVGEAGRPRTGVSASASASAMATVVTRRSRGEVVQEVDEQSLGRLAQHRLELLFEYAGQINAAPDEDRLCVSALECALAGTGFGRAAILRSVDAAGECEVLAAQVQRDGEGTPGTQPRFDISASLLAKAAAGKPAQLESIGGGAMPDYGQSVMDLRIHSALCVPVHVGDENDTFLYLDARGREGGVKPDATGFCVALARICGLAMSNLVRRELEKRQAEMVAQLGAAREAQQMIMPPERGVVGGLRYALRSHPGMFVAGDLFDLVELGPGRVGVFLGDVTGEGIGAGMLMASGQAHLHALLLQHGDPEIAVNEVNRYLAEHSPIDRFISLWVGVFDRNTGELTYVDAGHGHWALVSAKDNAASDAFRPEGRGGPPAAIDADVEYTEHTVPFAEGDRLVVFSDGVVEQSAAGEARSRDHFGMANVLGLLGASGSVEEDVESVMRAVLEHAGTEALDDDTTIASVAWEKGS
jgi:sigma-B regulation protein RsbU (phosphoserine phosphatase)